MREILFLEPVFKQRIWGGERLRDAFGYDIPGNDTGEAWAVSAHAQGDCRIKGGTYGGMTLGTLWKENRELFGNLEGNEFPLLVKIIDAREDLSIQVHPDMTTRGSMRMVRWENVNAGIFWTATRVQTLSWGIMPKARKN